MSDIYAADRVCFFAHYDANNIVSDSVIHYLNELKKCNFWIIVVSTSKLDAICQSQLLQTCDSVILRENDNLDWGGWNEVYQRYTDIRPELLLFCNDSVFGPLWPLKEFIDSLLAEEADVYGAVGSLELQLHIQSWFFMMRPKAYLHPAFQQRFRFGMPPHMAKWDIIQQFEVGMSHELMCDPSIRTKLAYDPRDYSIPGHAPFNPSHLIWRELLQLRLVPFVKKELLRDNPGQLRNVNNWQKIIGKISYEVSLHISDSVNVRKVKIRDLFRAVASKNISYRLFNQLLIQYDASPHNRWLKHLNLLIFLTVNYPLNVILRLFSRR